MATHSSDCCCAFCAPEGREAQEIVGPETGGVLHSSRWGPGPAGSPGGLLTWSIVDLRSDGTAVENTLLDKFQDRYGIDVERTFRDAFDIWSAVGNIEFLQILDETPAASGPDAAEITIVLRDIGLLGICSFPNGRSWPEIRMDALNPVWQGSDGANQFLTTAIHEIGHAIGFEHSTVNGTIMGNAGLGDVPNVTELQPDDIGVVRRLYGDQDFAPVTFALRGRSNVDLGYTAEALTVLGNGQDNLIDGTDRGEVIEGRNGADTLLGGGGDDRLVGGNGADLIDGGAGLDVAVASGAYAPDRLRVDGEVRLEDGGTQDVLMNIEAIAFADGLLLIDAPGTATGFLFRLYDAVLGRAPDPRHSLLVRGARRRRVGDGRGPELSRER